jgi:hypothetical protein
LRWPGRRIGGTIGSALLERYILVREVRNVRKLIAFDEDTFAKLKQLGRDRMASFQELADEAFADLLKKHGIPVDLKDALRKSASPSRESEKSRPARRTKLSTRSQ